MGCLFHKWTRIPPRYVRAYQSTGEKLPFCMPDKQGYPGGWLGPSLDYDWCVKCGKKKPSDTERKTTLEKLARQVKELD